MRSPRRRAVVSAMRAIAGTGCVLVLVSCIAVPFAPLYAAVAGTLSCALTASAALYAAYEGFDERLRGGPDP